MARSSLAPSSVRSASLRCTGANKLRSAQCSLSLRPRRRSCCASFRSLLEPLLALGDRTGALAQPSLEPSSSSCRGPTSCSRTCFATRRDPTRSIRFRQHGIRSSDRVGETAMGSAVLDGRRRGVSGAASRVDGAGRSVLPTPIGEDTRTRGEPTQDPGRARLVRTRQHGRHGLQTGRVFDGGASNIAWATTTNAGRTWTTGNLPATTIHEGGPGADQRPGSGLRSRARRLDDLDARLRDGLEAVRAPSAILTSRSTDGGLTWQARSPCRSARAASTTRPDRLRHVAG